MSSPSTLFAPAAPATASHEPLLNFNRQVIDQALALVAAHQARGASDYAYPVGAHLRHVIEHFEALLFPPVAGVVDYDTRARDAALERSPDVAEQRLRALRDALARGVALAAAVQVHGQGGQGGDFLFNVPSTLGRELVFVASHAIHHFALLQAHCLQQGIPTADGFGKAPSTVAHERAQRRAAPTPTNQTIKETA